VLGKPGAPKPTSPIVHRNHFGDASRPLTAFDFNCDIIGDPQPVGRRIICCLDEDSAAQPRVSGYWSQVPNAIGTVIYGILHRRKTMSNRTLQWQLLLRAFDVDVNLLFVPCRFSKTINTLLSYHHPVAYVHLGAHC